MIYFPFPAVYLCRSNYLLNYLGSCFPPLFWRAGCFRLSHIYPIKAHFPPAALPGRYDVVISSLLFFGQCPLYLIARPFAGKAFLKFSNTNARARPGGKCQSKSQHHGSLPDVGVRYISTDNERIHIPCSVIQNESPQFLHPSIYYRTKVFPSISFIGQIQPQNAAFKTRITTNQNRHHTTAFGLYKYGACYSYLQNCFDLGVSPAAKCAAARRFFISSPPVHCTVYPPPLRENA